MTTVTISLRNGRTMDGEKVRPPRDTVDLDRLSPRARALAEAVAASLGAKASFVWIERDDPASERHRSAQDRTKWGDPPSKQRWSAWDKYPADSPNDPHDFLERMAAKIPAGWHIIGPDPHTQVPTTDRLLTSQQVVATIARYRPAMQITDRTWRSYVSRGRAPQPARKVGRTPYWDPDDVVEWLMDRPGQGARTDLSENA